MFIVGIETTPQYQPAQCSFLGHGTSSCDLFLRVAAPDTDVNDTLLISIHAFKEMCKVMGYVPKDEKLRLLEEIKGEVGDLAPSISKLIIDLNDLRDQLDSLKVIADNVKQLQSSITDALESTDAATQSTISKGPERVLTAGNGKASSK